MDSEKEEENLQSRIRDLSTHGQNIEKFIHVSAQEYGWLVKKLEEPAQEIPALHALLTEVPMWNG